MAFLALPGLSRGCQGEVAAEEAGSPTFALSGFGSFRGSSLRLPSCCSVSAGPPRAAAASPKFSRRSKAASSTGDTGLLLGSWFGSGLVKNTAHVSVEGSWGGAVNTFAAQLSADKCSVAVAAKSGLSGIFSWKNVVSSPTRRNGPQSRRVGRWGGAGNVLPGDRHHTCQAAACPLPALLL